MILTHLSTPNRIINNFAGASLLKTKPHNADNNIKTQNFPPVEQKPQKQTNTKIFYHLITLRVLRITLQINYVIGSAWV